MKFSRSSVFFILSLVFIPITQSSSATPTGEPRWDEFEERTAFSLENRRSENSIHQIAPQNPNRELPSGRLESEGGFMNGNYHIEIPLINLPGRGQDFNLTLFYNSQILSIDRNKKVVFDADGNWPAPGANIGFGKLLFPNDNTSAKNSMLILPSGSRRPLKQAKTSTSGIVSAEFADGSGERVECSVDSDGCRKSGHHATAYLADGTTVKYITSKPRTSIAGINLYYPTQLIDAHLNSVEIRYRVINGVETPPHIDYIRDTVGRIFIFRYDENGLLIAITGFDENWKEDTVFVRFYYRQFREVIGVPDNTAGKQLEFFALTGIYFPGDQTGYVFEDFTPFGIPKTVSKNRNMLISTTSLTTQGSILNAGSVSFKSTFNYPVNNQWIRETKKLPSYTVRKDSWTSGNGNVSGLFFNEESTRYITKNDAEIEIHKTDSTIIQVIDPDPNSYSYGLIKRIEKWGKKGIFGVWLSTTNYNWEQTHDGIVRLKEVISHNHEINAIKRTVYEYGQNSRQITKEFQEGYLDPINLQPISGSYYSLKIKKEFLNDERYKIRNFNLPVSIDIYQNPYYPETPRSRRTEFKYDEAEPIFFHYPSSGRAPCSDKWCENETSTTTPLPRGNLTSVIKLIDTRENIQSNSYVKTNYFYDNLGNLIETMPDVPGFNSSTRYKYDSSTQYSWPSSITIGDRNNSVTGSVTTKYQYNRPIGLPTVITNADGQSTKFSYQLGKGGNWVVKQMTTPTGVTTTYNYNHAELSQEHKTVDTEGNVYSGKFYYNGRGSLVRREKFLTEINQTEITDFFYDSVGRLLRIKLPSTPDMARWVTYFYDHAGRLSQLINPDGSSKKWLYNENSRPSIVPPDKVGETVRMQDPWLRERWLMYDSTDKPKLVVEPNPNTGRVMDPGGTLTEYGYDLGNIDYILRWLQPPVVSQSSDLPMPELRWLFRHDGLGRLVCSLIPEKKDSYNSDFGFPCIPLTNSHYYGYDQLSNLILFKDARGVETHFAYNSDPLNRLQSVRYNLQNAEPVYPEIDPSPQVNFTYTDTGDPRRIKSIRTENVSTDTFRYDSFGRLEAHLFQFNKLLPYYKDFIISFSYDSLNRKRDMGYPVFYEDNEVVASNILRYQYSKDGDLKTIKLDGHQYEGHEPEHPYGLSAWNGPLVDIKRNVLGLIDSISFFRFANEKKLLTEFYSYDLVSGRYKGQKIVDYWVLPQQSPIDLIETDRSYEMTNSDGITAQYDQITRYQRKDPQKWNSNEPKEIDSNLKYDRLGRLIYKDISATKEAWKYEFDQSGNRTTAIYCKDNICRGDAKDAQRPTVRLDSNDMTNVFFDPRNNKIVSWGHYYDREGNLARGDKASGLGMQHYVYDAAGRLSRVMRDDGSLIEAYLYGADRRRIGVSNDLKNWRLSIWNGNAEIAHYNISDAGVINWIDMPIYLENRLIAKLYKPKEKNSALIKYFHRENQGTVLVTEHLFGNFKSYYQDHSPYGSSVKVVEQSYPLMRTLSTEDEYRFTNYSRSEKTGLDYAVNRYYDPKLGRFLEPDPLGIGAFDLSDPQSLNPYTYARNDPINRVDPLGLLECDGLKNLRDCPKYIPETTMISDMIYVLGEREPKNDPSMNPVNIPWYFPQVNTRNHGESEPKSNKSKNKSTNAECENLYQRNLSILENQKQAVKDASLRQVENLYNFATDKVDGVITIAGYLGLKRIDDYFFKGAVLNYIETAGITVAALSALYWGSLTAVTFASPGEIAAFNYSADNIETVFRNSRNPNACPKR